MNSEQMVFSLEFGKFSAPGLDRDLVEDGVGYFSPREEGKLLQRGQLFMIADGSGKAQQGDIASHAVIKRVIEEYYESSWLDDVEQMLHNAIQKANAALYQMNVESEWQSSLSCSVICVVVHGDALYAARVGNCHGFLISNNRLVEILPPPGDTTAAAISQKIHEETFVSERTNRLGLDPQIDIAQVTRRIQLKDIIFLCTHNVAAANPEDELALMLEGSEPAIACETAAKDTVRKFPDQDATALAIRVKGIRRLSFDESELPETILPSEFDEPKTTKREIVIKGVRYREDESGYREKESEKVSDFGRPRRSMRRPTGRQMPPRRKKPIPWGKIIGIPLLLAVLGLVGYAAVKYVPQYWKSLTEPKPGIETITADTLEQLKSPIEKQQKPPVDSIAISANIPESKVKQDTSKQIAARDTSQKVQPAEVSIASFQVAVVDGSGSTNASNRLKPAIAAAVKNDNVRYFKSRYLIRNSKILWRKSSDPLKMKYVTNQLLIYSNAFTKTFGIKPEIYPLDFSLVLGADFKIPPIQDRYMELTDEKNDYYIEILNGSKVSGLARKMSNILHHQRFDDKRLVVVDYRNADKLTYLKSFIKCESSKNEIALRMAKDFGLPSLITNAPLYDIKIIIGRDVRR